MPSSPRAFLDPAFDRRALLSALAGLGAASPEMLAFFRGRTQESTGISAEALAAFEPLHGIPFSPSERELMLKGLTELRSHYDRLRSVPLSNDVSPALVFDPVLPGSRIEHGRRASKPRDAQCSPDPERAVGSPFESVAQLSTLLRARKLRSVDLTRTYIERLKRYDPLLHCAITLTEDRAMEQAQRADSELDQGSWRGPLHGIPWGAKDLLAVKGYATTWGATPFKDQRIEEDATVVRRLDEAGAVLIAKLSLGELAWGDVWFEAQTRNPWKPEQGSSGSSAGSAAATAAGLVGFAIGSETWGSIVSPCTQCGATGLRPTFGRVSRHGAMTLSWSMDKLGPIGRTVEDCAFVLQAIAGPDGNDGSVKDVPFTALPEIDIAKLRVGYVKSLFEGELEGDEAREWRNFDLRALDALRALGVQLVPIELPRLPVASLAFILNAEAAAAFDELTRSGQDELLVRQVEMAWPNVFRQARTIPAVEYIQANRVRTLLLRDMERIFSGVDAYVCPTFGGDHLLLTNLTGHPAVVVPHGFKADGTPSSITFSGRLFGEEELIALAHAYQSSTGFHLQHPALPE